MTTVPDLDALRGRYTLDTEAICSYELEEGGAGGAGGAELLPSTVSTPRRSPRGAQVGASSSPSTSASRPSGGRP